MLATAFSGLIAAGSMIIILVLIRDFQTNDTSSHFADGERCWETFLGSFGHHPTSQDTFQLIWFKKEWLFIIEGSMTVGIAIILLPLLTDYPLQSKHLFLTKDMQLYAVS